MVISARLFRDERSANPVSTRRSKSSSANDNRCFPTGMFEIPATRNFGPLGFGARILSFYRVQPLAAWPECSVARGVSLDFITHARIPLS
jgi:hypothetical protein